MPRLLRRSAPTPPYLLRHRSPIIDLESPKPKTAEQPKAELFLDDAIRIGSLPFEFIPEIVPAQPVDATPLVQLIWQYFLPRQPLCAAVLNQARGRAVLRLKQRSRTTLSCGKPCAWVLIWCCVRPIETTRVTRHVVPVHTSAVLAFIRHAPQSNQLPARPPDREDQRSCIQRPDPLIRAIRRERHRKKEPQRNQNGCQRNTNSH
jgi:hypothetical protein